MAKVKCPYCEARIEAHEMVCKNCKAHYGPSAIHKSTKALKHSRI